MPKVFASLVVWLRYLVVILWIVAAAATAIYLPALGSGQALELGGLIPDDSPAIQAGERSQQLFSVPLTADTAVVERAPEGFSREEQEAIVQRAVDASSGEQAEDAVRFALPILNTRELFPGSEEDGTTAVTHLFFLPDVSLTSRVELAREYRDQAGDGDYAGVTGPGPARLAQFEEIENALPLVELGTVLAIALVVGPPSARSARRFSRWSRPGSRSSWPGSDPLGGRAARRRDPAGGGAARRRADARNRHRLHHLLPVRLPARARARDSATRGRAALVHPVAPIVATAGLIVVTGTAALVVGELEFFRAFGPALALTAAISLAVSITFVPASLALFGRLVFWPSLTPREEGSEDEEPLSPVRSRIAEILTSRPTAALVALVTIAGLVAAASGIRHTELALRLGSGLPSDNEVQEAAVAADQGFAAGVLAPTIVLVEGQGVADRGDGLARLEEGIGQVPGVAGVLGPSEQPAEAPRDVLLSEDGNAARIVAILDDSPLDSEAIETSQALDERLPALVQEAGLDGANAALTGQTAIASDTVQAIVDSSALVGAVSSRATSSCSRSSYVPSSRRSTCSRRACSPSRRRSA